MSNAAKDIFAGTCGGIANVLVCHPLDTIRVRLQVDAGVRYSGIVDVIGQTVRNEGAFAFYKGFTPPLFAQVLMKSNMFLAVGFMKRLFREQNQGKPLSVGQFWTCGAVAGSFNAAVSSPIELIRNRLQVQYEKNPKQSRYHGPLHCARQIVKEYGFFSLWRGTGLMILRDLPGVGAWIAGFELCRQQFVPAGGTLADVKMWQLMLSGSAGGILFWTFGFPQDTLKSIVQTAHSLEDSGKDSATKKTTPWNTVKHVVRERGILSLYHGFPIAVIRGIPGAAITFTTVATVQKMFKDVA